MLGCHHFTSLVTDKQSAAQPLRGLLIRTCEEANMTRGHLYYKYWEFVKTIREFWFGQGYSLLTWNPSEDPWDTCLCLAEVRNQAAAPWQRWVHIRTGVFVPKQCALETGHFYFCAASRKSALGWAPTLSNCLFI